MMTGLNKLNVMNNQLKDVPNEMRNLTRLTQFDFQGNSFSGEVQQKILNLMSGEPAPTEPAQPVKKATPKKVVKKKAVRKK
ncbi:MAG: hypothetical protein RIQ62_259 [Bacteroidota bacterium]